MNNDIISNKENNTDANEIRQPLLPDGIGLEFDTVRTLLAKEHNTKIPHDDPMLMMVTLINCSLTEQEKLQKLHETALGKMMAQHTNNYVKNTEKGMQEIMSTLSALTTKGLNEAAKDMVKFKTSMIYCTAITFISSLLIVGVFVLQSIKG